MRRGDMVLWGGQPLSLDLCPQMLVLCSWQIWKPTKHAGMYALELPGSVPGPVMLVLCLTGRVSSHSN